MHLVLCSCSTHTLCLIIRCLFLVLFWRKKKAQEKSSLEHVHDAQPILVREIICLCNLFHPRITVVSHGDKFTDVRNVHEVISHMSHSIHDALFLVLQVNDGGLER
jgi:hypothetical protein